MGRWANLALFFGSAAAGLVVYGLVSGGPCLSGDEAARVGPQGRTERPAAADPSEIDRYVKAITRRGNHVRVPKELANEVKKDNLLVLSKVAVRTRLDEGGRLEAYELVQIDRGGIPERLGFRPKDLITGVNGIPARDIMAKEASLESASRFDVRIVRKGKARRLIVEIR
ncbi:MAG: hypothetical protein ABSC19_19515 [Syntrophorhabdales bacterium]|jgi:hypothetical protein